MASVLPANYVVMNPYLSMQDMPVCCYYFFYHHGSGGSPLALPAAPWYPSLPPVHPIEAREVPQAPPFTGLAGGVEPPQRAVLPLRKGAYAGIPRRRGKVHKNGASSGGSEEQAAGGVFGGGCRWARRGLCGRRRSAHLIPRLRCFRKPPSEVAKASDQLHFQVAEVAADEGLDSAQSMAVVDVRTTVMIKNLPNKLGRNELLHILDMHCVAENKVLTVCGQQEHQPHDIPSRFNLIYLPIDFSTGCNLGYAFVNFTSAAAAMKLHRAYHRFPWKSYGSGKVCEVTYARIQGLPALLRHLGRTRFSSSVPDVLALRFVPYRDGVLHGECHAVGKLVSDGPTT